METQMDVVDDLRSRIPGTMAALMQRFIDKKDVNARVSLRLQMKALLDFNAVDTEFPPNPLVKKDTGPSPARDAAIYAGGPGIEQQQGPNLGFGMPNTVYPIPVVEAVPGAQRLDNSDILT